MAGGLGTSNVLGQLCYKVPTRVFQSCNICGSESIKSWNSHERKKDEVKSHNKVLLEHSRAYWFAYLVCDAFVLCQQSWVVAVQIIWPIKPKIFTAWHFTGKVFRSCGLNSGRMHTDMLRQLSLGVGIMVFKKCFVSKYLWVKVLFQSDTVFEFLIWPLDGAVVTRDC